MYRFFLDGKEIEDPQGYDSLTTVIEYDRRRSQITCKANNTLTFYGSAYECIKNAYVPNGICVKLPITVMQDCNDGKFETIIKGVLFMTDIVLEPCKCLAKAKIVDDNISSFIDNNKELKIYPEATKSKTSTQDNLTPTPSKTLEVVTRDGLVGNATFKVSNIKGYDLKDVLSHQVQFMSDGELEFKSDFLDNLDTCFLITDGPNVREETDDMFFCFGDLVDTLTKAFNLVMFPEGDQICLEPLDYMESRAPVLEIDCVNDIEISTNTDELYGSVSIGNNNEENEDNQTNINLIKSNCLQHRKETFTISTQCNTRSVLDLTYDCVTSHNTIRSITFGNDSFDDVPIFIEYDCDTCETVYDDPFDTWSQPDLPGFVLNPSFYNCKLLENYCFVGDVYKINQSAVVDPFFKAYDNINGFSEGYEGSEDNSVQWTFQFQDDFASGFDNGNTYGNGTTQGDPVAEADSYFCAPADGSYTFCVELNGTLKKGPSTVSFPGQWQNFPVNVGTSTRYNAYIRLKYCINDSAPGGSEFYAASPFNNAVTSSGAPAGLNGYIDQSLYSFSQLTPGSGVSNGNLAPNKPVWITTQEVLPFTITDCFTVNLVAGDKVNIKGCYDTYFYDINDVECMQFTINNQCFNLQSANIGEGAGGVIFPGTDEKNLSKVKFQHCLTQEQIVLLLKNKYNAVTVKSECLFPLTAYIDKLTVNHTTKEASFDLRANIRKI